MQILLGNELFKLDKKRKVLTLAHSPCSRAGGLWAILALGIHRLLFLVNRQWDLTWCQCFLILKRQHISGNIVSVVYLFSIPPRCKANGVWILKGIIEKAFKNDYSFLCVKLKNFKMVQVNWSKVWFKNPLVLFCNLWKQHMPYLPEHLQV